MAKTKNQLLSMTYSQVREYCDILNINRPKNATRTTMIQLILTTDPPTAYVAVNDKQNDTNQNTNSRSPSSTSLNEQTRSQSAASHSQPRLCNDVMTPHVMQQQPQQLHTAENNSREHQNMNRNNKKDQAQKPITEEDKKRAESLKTEGNKLVRLKKYQQAVEKYTEAIECYPQNAVYFSNRAAAFTYLQNYKQAVVDSRKASTIDSNYVKAYVREGLAEYDAYAKALSKTKSTDKNWEEYKQKVELCKMKIDISKARCTDCMLVKGGQIYEEDQMFYCFECFNAYEDEAGGGALQKDNDGEKPGAFVAYVAGVEENAVDNLYFDENGDDDDAEDLYVEEANQNMNDVADEKEAVGEVEVCYFFNHGGCNADKGKSKRKCKFVHKRYVDVLREYHSAYYQSKDVNVKNIGIYLKNSLDGFDKIADKANPGYIKYGTYARTFCEVVTNYLLKEKSLDLTLYKKIQQLSHRPSFPQKEMNFIRLSTNKIIHGVNYNESARERFIPTKDQQKMLLNVYIITRWINKEIARN